MTQGGDKLLDMPCLNYNLLLNVELQTRSHISIRGPCGVLSFIMDKDYSKVN